MAFFGPKLSGAPFCVRVDEACQNAPRRIEYGLLGDSPLTVAFPDNAARARRAVQSCDRVCAADDRVL
jgi:hypothetical protein